MGTELKQGSQTVNIEPETAPLRPAKVAEVASVFPMNFGMVGVVLVGLGLLLFQRKLFKR